MQKISLVLAFMLFAGERRRGRTESSEKRKRNPETWETRDEKIGVKRGSEGREWMGRIGEERGHRMQLECQQASERSSDA